MISRHNQSGRLAATSIPRRLIILWSPSRSWWESGQQLLLWRLAAAVVAFQHDGWNVRAPDHVYHHVFKPVFPGGSLDHCVLQSN
jgi:hypothetical protein